MEGKPKAKEQEPLNEYAAQVFKALDRVAAEGDRGGEWLTFAEVAAGITQARIMVMIDGQE